MILIDAVYINNSGGLALLEYLISNLSCLNIECHYLLDNRVEGKILSGSNSFFVKPSELARYNFYKRNNGQYDKILCFANVPPPMRLNAKVFTLFHNIFLLSIPAKTSFKNKLNWFVKRQYIKKISSNADFWIVQTTNTFNELNSILSIAASNILIIPFYDLNISTDFKDVVRSDYSFVSNYVYQKNHEILIDAWYNLLLKGYTPTLHLTLSQCPRKLIDKINSYNKCGTKIINHGYCNKNDINNIYNKSKVLIYPSINESLGLCLLEAMSNNCDIIAPDLPYINSICSPSITFDLDPDSIANAVICYENNGSTNKKTVCTITNQIHNLIKLLS